MSYKQKIYPLEAAGPHTPLGEIRERCYEELVSHYPVTDNGIYRGMIRCEDLDNADEHLRLTDASYLLENIYITDNLTDWTQVFARFLSNETNILPVIDRDRHYLGVLMLEDLLEELSEIKAFSENGTVIRIQKTAEDFSFSQVAQIAESTGAEVLGILLVDRAHPYLTADIKIRTGDINEILQTFRRYDYQVLSQHPEDKHLQELKENAGYLDRYLRMGE